MSRFPVSIASYSFHGMLAQGRTDVFSYLSDLKYRYGVRYADIWSGFLPTLEDEFIKKVRLSMDENGIILANLCVDGPHVWDDDEEVREKNYKNALEYLHAAEILGAKTVRIDMGSRDDEVPEHKFDYIVAKYKEYCRICEGFGARVGTENHWGSSRIPKNLEKLYKAVDSPAYGHLFHFGNFVEGCVDEGLETVIKMAMHTHIAADMIPFAKEYVRRLATSGYKGTYSVEHHTGKLEHRRVAWQLASLLEIIAELEEEGIENTATPSYMSGLYGAPPRK